MEKDPNINEQPVVIEQPPSISAIAIQQPGAETSSWTSSLWDCFKGDNNLFAWTCFCPCIVYAATQSRLRGRTAVIDHQLVNSDCCLYCVTAGARVHWVLPLQARREVRTRFNIPGNFAADCVASFFCTCCVQMQHEKELAHRNKIGDTAIGYIRPLPMSTEGGADSGQLESH